VPSNAEDTVALPKDLAGPEPMLELGIGTGRIAHPLARRGSEVHGVEASEAMVKKLRGRTGGECIPVTVGDFACTSAGEAGAGNRSRPRASNTSRSTKDRAGPPLLAGSYLIGAPIAW
jgi:16S rRNA A1518/A1519 N6-dimethyltransferase RsmA/KsgA/DIM1 with predicted DNA glycosylase/AP lyase activity